VERGGGWGVQKNLEPCVIHPLDPKKTTCERIYVKSYLLQFSSTIENFGKLNLKLLNLISIKKNYLAKKCQLLVVGMII